MLNVKSSPRANSRGQKFAPSELEGSKVSSGFTLIELLVVISIIGLLASITMTAMNNARIKARDARRLTDIKQIKTGLDLYFSHGSGYPPKVDFDNSAATGINLSCGTTPILKVPVDPLNILTYSYTYQNAGPTVNGCGTTGLSLRYTFTFVLEKDDVTYTMDEDGQITPALPY